MQNIQPITCTRLMPITQTPRVENNIDERIQKLNSEYKIYINNNAYFSIFIGTKKSEHNIEQLQKYYNAVNIKLIKLAKNIGIDIHSYLLTPGSGSPHLPNFEMFATLLDSHKKILTEYYLKWREDIAYVIGKIPRGLGEVTNSAEEEVQLYTQCLKASKAFHMFVCARAKEVNGTANFGAVGDFQLIKKTKSYCRKIDAETEKLIESESKRGKRPDNDSERMVWESDLRKKAIKNQRDVIRGTIYVDTVWKIIDLIHNIKSLSNKHKIGDFKIKNIIFKDIFRENPHREDGYASIHLKMGMAYENARGAETYQIASEIQLQFDLYFNGTQQCTKELTHVIMDYNREIETGDLNFKDCDQKKFQNLANTASLFHMSIAMETIMTTAPVMSKSLIIQHIFIALMLGLTVYHNTEPNKNRLCMDITCQKNDVLFFTMVYLTMACFFRVKAGMDIVEACKCMAKQTYRKICGS